MADFPGIRAAELQRRAVQDGELNKHICIGAAQDSAREIKACPEACRSATTDATPEAKRLWEGLYF